MTSPAPVSDSAAATGSRPLHPRSFKLRFAPVREPGRSYLSMVKPTNFPAPVGDKFYARAAGGAASAEEIEREERAWRRVCDAFERNPRDRLTHPQLSSHEYGWWWREGLAAWQRLRGDPRVHRPIRESPALRAVLRPAPA